MGQAPDLCGSPSRGNRIRRDRRSNGPIAQAPPVLTHRPCHSQIPHHTSSSTATAAVAWQTHCGFDSPVVSERVPVQVAGRASSITRSRGSIARREPFESVSRLIVAARAPTARQDRFGGPWLGFQVQARIPPKQSAGAAQLDSSGGYLRMTRVPYRIPFLWICLVCALTTISGCQRGDRLESAGITLAPPGSWRQVDRLSIWCRASRWRPGRALRVQCWWSTAPSGCPRGLPRCSPRRWETGWKTCRREASGQAHRNRRRPHRRTGRAGRAGIGQCRGGQRARCPGRAARQNPDPHASDHPGVRP